MPGTPELLQIWMFIVLDIRDEQTLARDFFVIHLWLNFLPLGQNYMVK